MNGRTNSVKKYSNLILFDFNGNILCDSVYQCLYVLELPNNGTNTNCIQNCNCYTFVRLINSFFGFVFRTFSELYSLTNIIAVFYCYGRLNERASYHVRLSLNLVLIETTKCIHKKQSDRYV